LRKAIDYFKKAFGKKAKGFSLLCKPQKIYLENSNLLLYWTKERFWYREGKY